MRKNTIASASSSCDFSVPLQAFATWLKAFIILVFPASIANEQPTMCGIPSHSTRHLRAILLVLEIRCAG